MGAAWCRSSKTQLPLLPRPPLCSLPPFSLFCSSPGVVPDLLPKPGGVSLKCPSVLFPLPPTGHPLTCVPGRPLTCGAAPASNRQIAHLLSDALCPSSECIFPGQVPPLAPCGPKDPLLRRSVMGPSPPGQLCSNEAGPVHIPASLLHLSMFPSSPQAHQLVLHSIRANARPTSSTKSSLVNPPHGSHPAGWPHALVVPISKSASQPECPPACSGQPGHVAPNHSHPCQFLAPLACWLFWAPPWIPRALPGFA